MTRTYVGYHNGQNINIPVLTGHFTITLSIEQTCGIEHLGRVHEGIQSFLECSKHLNIETTIPPFTRDNSKSCPLIDLPHMNFSTDGIISVRHYLKYMNE